MNDMKVIRYKEMTLNRPIAVIGFPTIGLVGSIIASYISKELKMEVIAGIASPELPAYAILQNGYPYPPVRVYGYNRDDVDDDFEDLVIITSEITPRPEKYYELAETMLELLKELNIKDVVILEGTPRIGEDDAMVACGSADGIRSRIADLELTPLNEGLIRGMTGVMLYKGIEYDINVMAIMCPANPALPDPRSAADILKPLSKLIPELNLNVEPLYKEAEEIERTIKAQQEEDIADTQKIYG